MVLLIVLFSRIFSSDEEEIRIPSAKDLVVRVLLMSTLLFEKDSIRIPWMSLVPLVVMELFAIVLLLVLLKR